MPDRQYDTAVYVRRMDAHRSAIGATVLHRDAQISQLDTRDKRFPGATFQLHVSLTADPETGHAYDADGDRAEDRCQHLHGAVSFINGNRLTVQGYAPDLDPDDDPTGSFQVVHWTQIPFSQLARRDEERAANAALAGQLDDRDRQLLVALRTHALDALAASSPRDEWVRMTPGCAVPVSGLTLTPADVTRLLSHPAGELIMTSERVEGFGATRGPVISVALVTRGEDIADAIINRTAPPAGTSAPAHYRV